MNAITKEILRLMHASSYAFEGLAYLWKEQKNSRLLFVISILSIITCPLIGFSIVQTAIVFTAVIMATVAEILNTAIEITLDLQCGGKFDPKVKIAKDVSSCAVLICVCNSVLLTLIFFFYNLLGSVS